MKDKESPQDVTAESVKQVGGEDAENPAKNYENNYGVAFTTSEQIQKALPARGALDVITADALGNMVDGIRGGLSPEGEKDAIGEFNKWIHRRPPKDPENPNNSKPETPNSPSPETPNSPKTEPPRNNSVNPAEQSQTETPTTQVEVSQAQAVQQPEPEPAQEVNGIFSQAMQKTREAEQERKSVLGTKEQEQEFIEPDKSVADIDTNPPGLSAGDIGDNQEPVKKLDIDY